MSNYKPPYTITSKMLSLSTAIAEELTKIEFERNKIITPMRLKKNRIKTIAGTLEIEGKLSNFKEYKKFGKRFGRKFGKHRR